MPVAGKMVSMLDEPRYFTVSTVTKEHDERMIEIPGTSAAVKELNFKCYDEYKVADLYMS